jgi:hypothetical protein
MLLTSACVFACGWFPTHSGKVLLYRIIPLDESDYHNYATTWKSDCKLHHRVDYKAENINLWQEQTSLKVNIDDIEHVVYKTEATYLQDNKNRLDQLNLKDNTFINWIVSNKRTDIIEYLIMAKQSEDVRFSMNDPWYYRVEDSYHFRVLDEIVEKCRQYNSGPLLNRYALQMVRALCTLREYDECAKYWDNIKGKLDNNVIKIMTELRAADALYKTGRKDEALEIYARHGDVSSIRAINGGEIHNELEFVYEHNPNSPYLEEELQKWLIYFGDDSTEQSYKNGHTCSWDVEKLNDILKVAHRAVQEKKTKSKAMWYYTLAALYDIKGEPHKAKKYLHIGQQYPKDSFLSDSYHVLKMWLEAKTATYNLAYEQRLMNDLKWLEQKIKKEVTPEAYEKLNFDEIWQKEYTDDNRDVYQCEANTFYWNDAMRRLLLRVVCPRMHEAGKHIREIQLANMAENCLVKTNGFSGEMFVIIDRLSYIETRDYFSRIYHPKSNFDRFLNSKGRTDKYYWYDIMATKCLRERRYEKALVYLRQIPVKYQEKLSVYSYMNKQPFSYDMETFSDDSLLAPNYKLHFAEAMSKYEKAMKYQKDPNIRAESMIQYALGLRNSVHRCWFLTRYSSNSENDYIRRALPDISYPEDSTIYHHNEFLELSDKLINEAILSYTDKEKAAIQLRQLLRYQRIMDNYSETATAMDIRLHCDKWRDYYLRKTNR